MSTDAKERSGKKRRQDPPGMVPYKPKRVKADPKLRVYVNNLPYDAEWTKLKEHMKSGGYKGWVFAVWSLSAVLSCSISKSAHQ